VSWNEINERLNEWSFGGYLVGATAVERI